MRRILSVSILLFLPLAGVAQDAPKNGEKKPAAEKQPSAWQMPESYERQFSRYLKDYLDPKRNKSRQDVLERFQKLVDRAASSSALGGHSLLEDVPTITKIANGLRPFNPRAGRHGHVEEIEVKPEVHGFPGGIGTVRYWLYVPRDYSTANDRLWPLLFCLPDNRKWPEGSDYIQKVWLDRSDTIKENFLIVVPRPQAKGDLWSQPKSLARAMIALRHASGTYGCDPHTAGPAVDMRRLFLDGNDFGAVVAARFREMFVGAVLHGATGKMENGPDLRDLDALNGLPAYCIVDKNDSSQEAFAQEVKKDNDASVIQEDTGDLMGKAEAAAVWMQGLKRVDQPDQLDYAVYDPSFQRDYWINVLDYDATVKPAPRFHATIDRKANAVIVTAPGITRFELFLNDALLDLSKPVQVFVQDGDQKMNLFPEKKGVGLERSLATMLEELVGSNHPWRIYPVRLQVDVAKVRAQYAKEHPAKAGGAAAKPKGGAGSNGPAGNEAGKEKQPLGGQ